MLNNTVIASEQDMLNHVLFKRTYTDKSLEFIRTEAKFKDRFLRLRPGLNKNELDMQAFCAAYLKINYHMKISELSMAFIKHGLINLFYLKSIE